MVGFIMAAGSHPCIAAVVFDLDDTLYDCYHQRVLQAHRHACRKLLAAGLRRTHGRQPTVSSLYRLRRRLFQIQPDLDNLDIRLCLHLGLGRRAAGQLAKIGRRAYYSFPVGKIRLYADVIPTFRRLHRSGVALFVITAGQPSIQRAKAHRLGLMQSPYIRAILFTGKMHGRGKKAQLTQLLRRGYSRKSVLVVGDRPDSEIRAARELGLWTVRRHGGEFAPLRPNSPPERAHYTIQRISELFSLPFVFTGTISEHGPR